MAAKPLAELIDDCLAPALAARGFAGRASVSLWPGIVGERLAARAFRAIDRYPPEGLP
jgi:hypothetical protein